MKKIILIPLVLFALAFLFIGMPSTQAAGIGASPGFIHFDNMLRNGYAEGFVTVSIGTADFVGVTATPKGEIADWFEFPEGPHFMVNAANPKHFKIVIRPPDDVANGDYEGFIRFTTSPLGKVTSGAGSAIQVSVDVKIKVTITDLQFLKCQATGFVIKDAEQGQPILFSASIYNKGNVRIKPAIDVTIWNQRQDKIVDTFNKQLSQEILPTTKQTVFFNIPSTNLVIAQYWASITVNPCQDNKLLTFDIVEPGTLGLEGVLKTIITKVWAERNEIVPIVAVFQNLGETPVKAKFKGSVQESGRIIQLLESDEITVGVGEEANLTTFFTPKAPGRYVVKGKVFYGTKQTYENTGIINVAGIRVNYTLIAVYILVVALLIFIIYRLLKRKKRVY